MPDALAATLLSYKTVPTRKVFQMTLELPIEQASQAIALFGRADPDGATWLAVARLGARVPANPEPVAEPEKATGGGVERKERKLSEIAAIKCQDQEFRSWFLTNYPTGKARGRLGLPIVGEISREEAINLVAHSLRDYLGIESRRELDAGGPKARAFEALLTDFDMRNTVR